MRLSSEQEFSGEQSRQIAALIREEIARRRMSRQQLADKARLSLSTLEKVLGGRRLLTLATAVRVEEALGVSLRRTAPDVEVFKDGGISGAKEINERPEFTRTLAALHANGVKLILVEKLDRLARDLLRSGVHPCGASQTRLSNCFSRGGLT